MILIIILHSLAICCCNNTARNSISSLWRERERERETDDSSDCKIYLWGRGGGGDEIIKSVMLFICFSKMYSSLLSTKGV